MQIIFFKTINSPISISYLAVRNIAQNLCLVLETQKSGSILSYLPCKTEAWEVIASLFACLFFLFFYPSLGRVVEMSEKLALRKYF